MKNFHLQWKRLGGLHGIIAMMIYRFGRFVYVHVKIPVIRQVLWIMYRLIDMIILRIIIGSEIPAQCSIGKGIILPHGASGIYIQNNAVICDHVTVYHQVTIGIRYGDDAPYIEDNVFIGAGAKILGRIVIGSNSKIGANAVVLNDVPSNCTAVGIPAKINFQSNL